MGTTRICPITRGIGHKLRPGINPWSPERVVHILTDPEGATILLNGNSACTTPCELHVVAGQEQHLTARLQGHLDTVTTTAVDPRLLGRQSIPELTAPQPSARPYLFVP